MGADLTASVGYLQGLILQDPRFTAAYIDDSASSASTQAGPLPGFPVAQQDTDMVLDAVGSQSAGKQLRVRVQRSGHPGTDEASSIWRYQGETLWTGWDAPLSISDFEYIDISNVNDKWEFPDAVVTADGKIVVVVQKDNRYVVSLTRDPDAGTWTEKTIYDKGSTYDAGKQPRPCILLLPSGRLKCFFWSSTTSQITIRMHYSDDDGATWTAGQFDCLDSGGIFSGAVYNTGRMRAVYLNGQVMLLASRSGGSPNHELLQYASDSLGTTFHLIDTIASGNSRVAPVLMTNRAGNRIIAAYVSYGSSGQVSPFVRVLGSAAEPLSSADFSNVVVGGAEWGQHSSGTFSSFELAGFRDQDGSLYLFGNDHDAAGGAKRELTVLRSNDDGATWEAPGDSSATNHDSASVWYGNDAAFFLRDYCAVSWRGMGVLIHMGAVGGEALLPFADSLMATFLGGYTRVCQPQYSDIQENRIGGRASWERTWLPFCRPQDLPFWTHATAGSPTEGHGVKGRNVTHTTASDQVYWYGTPTTDLDGGLIVLADFETDTNDDLEVYIDLQISNGSTKNNNIRVVVDGTSLEVFDNGTGSTSKGTASAGAADGIQILAAIAEDVCSVWYRLKGTDTAWQQWVNVVDGAAISSNVATTSRIEWGTLTGQDSGTASFRLFCHSQDNYTGAQLAGGQNNPRRLLGRSIVPTPVYVNDGVSIFASDGPGVRPDQWNIDTRYTYSYDNTDPRKVPSPQMGHRTLDDTADADIVWTIGETTADEQAQMGSFFAMYLGELNWRTGEVWARSGGTWSKIIDIDTALTSVPTTLGFTRKGFNILPNLASGGSLEAFVHEHILEGCTWDYGDDSTRPRKINTNTSGAWTRDTTGTTKPPRLMLETYGTADPASGTTGRIWSKEAVVLLPRTLLSTYDAIRLRVKAQDTADGDLRTGVALLGWFMPFGEVYSQGRGIGIEPNYEMTTGRNGARNTRSLGRNRRAVEFDWTDGVWEGGITDNTPAPDYFRYLQSSGEVIAHPGSVAEDMRGVYERAKGALEPLVYVSRVPIQTGPGLVAVTLTNRDWFLYGRLVSETFRIDVAEGDEWSTTRPEFKRVNVTRVEGEV